MKATPTRARRNQSARELAIRFGVTPRTIRNTVAEERSEYLRRAQESDEKIRELRATGMTVRAIAAELGYSVGKVHRAIKQPPNAA